MGKFIPKVVITSNNFTHVLDALSEDGINRISDGSLRKTKRFIRDVAKGEATGKDYKNKPLLWFHAQNKKKSYRGRFVKLDSSSVTLHNGKKEISVQLEHLSPGAKQLAYAFGKGSDSTQMTKAQTPLMQSWTNTSGKTIQAELVSLAGDQVTLKMDNGKTYTLPLSKFDEASQQQARAHE